MKKLLTAMMAAMLGLSATAGLYIVSGDITATRVTYRDGSRARVNAEGIFTIEMARKMRHL